MYASIYGSWGKSFLKWGFFLHTANGLMNAQFIRYYRSSPVYVVEPIMIARYFCSYNNYNIIAENPAKKKHDERNCKVKK